MGLFLDFLLYGHPILLVFHTASKLYSMNLVLFWAFLLSLLLSITLPILYIFCGKKEPESRG